MMFAYKLAGFGVDSRGIYVGAWRHGIAAKGEPPTVTRIIRCRTHKRAESLAARLLANEPA